MNNGMISVKDKEIMQKRKAFMKTIEMHKKLLENQPNAIFKSSIERDCSLSKLHAEAEKNGKKDVDRSAYGTTQTMLSTHKH